MKTVFLRVLEAEDKATALLDAVREPERARGRQRFEVDTDSFGSVPRSPFAYWVSAQIRALFQRFPRADARDRIVQRTNSVDDNFRFVRLHWEAEIPSPNGDVDWYSWAKGGSFSPYYYDLDTMICWSDARGTYPGFLGTPSRPLERPASANLFFRPALTWPLRTNGLSFRAMPAGCIFGAKGSALCVPNDLSEHLMALCAVLNSRVFGYLVSLQLARTELAQSYEVGLIQQTPIPDLSAPDRVALTRLARRAWSLERSLDTRIETSHAFVLPALLQVAAADLAARAAIWSEHVRTAEAELVAIQSEIDERCFVLYGIDEADRRAITEGFGTSGSEEASNDGANDADEDDAGGDTDENHSTADPASLAAELVSWAVGVAFGRFDVRLATGARPMPTEPEPFDPLPACSPGMLTGADGLPLTRPPAGYPVAFPEAGVLVDDLGHAHDLSTAVRAVFDAIFGADADRWWTDVAALLDPKGRDLRVWLAGSFFEHHVKRYSKSRRKAPIFWQLGTPSGRYSVWLYARRLTRDSFFQLQNEVVGPKLSHEERQLTILMQNAGGSPSAAERKDIAGQESFVEELRAFRDEVARIAPLWNPDLNDGVIINFAPLWRLVPYHRPWQKGCKDWWDKLVAGDYDWAHLAMHLWPERVVPKCADDRSLAIAHGLEEVFWVEGSDGKWQKREVDDATIKRLVADRTSPAVKDAIKSLLDAPAPGGRRSSVTSRRPKTESQKPKTDRGRKSEEDDGS